MRPTILHNCIFFFLGLIIIALCYMQVVKGGFYHDLSTNNHIRVIPVDSPRGRILDKNGAVLADNLASFNIAVIPQDVEDKDALFNFLGVALGKDAASLKRLYYRRRGTSFDPTVIARDVDRKTVILVEENRILYPGLVIEESFERYYPFDDIGSHVVGYIGRIDPREAEMLQSYGYTPLSLVGKSGVEKSYESVLEGTDGGRQIEVNSRGQEVRLLGFKEPAKGKDIVLTIDQRIQSAATELLNGRRGSVVIMDLKNGDILSMVSSPGFDPNAFTDYNRQGKIQDYVRSSIFPLLNRSISGQYPPGSVLKIPVALAAFEKNKIGLQTSFDCPGYYMLGAARFGCAHVHHAVDLLHAIAYSCNVFFYHVGQKVTAPIIGAYAKAFGLSRLTGIDLPFEAKGSLVLPGNKKGGWYTGNTLNLSIGQGDTLVTPLQLTVMMGAVATDGIMLQPRIVRAIDEKVLPDPDLSRRPIIRLKDASWRMVQKGMRMSIDEEEGTAHLLSDLASITIAGKTGTAQAGQGENHAWFSGYLRSPKKNLAFTVFLEHGGSSANAVTLLHDLLLQAQSFGVI